MASSLTKNWVRLIHEILSVAMNSYLKMISLEYIEDTLLRYKLTPKTEGYNKGINILLFLLEHCKIFIYQTQEEVLELQDGIRQFDPPESSVDDDIESNEVLTEEEDEENEVLVDEEEEDEETLFQALLSCLGENGLESFMSISMEETDEDSNSFEGAPSKESHDAELLYSTNHPILPRDEELRLIKSAQLAFVSDNSQNRKQGYRDLEKLIRHNVRLVLSVVNKHYYKRGELTFGDLMQEGMIGLVKSIQKFEEAKECKLSTYATWWIRQKIDRAIKDSSKTIRFPVYFYDKLIALKKIMQEIRKDGGDETDIESLAKRSSLSAKRVKFLLKIMPLHEIVSLSTPVTEEGDELQKFIPDTLIPLPEKEILDKDRHDVVRRVLSTLTVREETIIRKRFGLDGDKPKTLDVIGKESNVTRERIRQVEAKAIKKLRHPSRSELLKQVHDVNRGDKDEKK